MYLIQKIFEKLFIWSSKIKIKKKHLQKYRICNEKNQTNKTTNIKELLRASLK